LISRTAPVTSRTTPVTLITGKTAVTSHVASKSPSSVVAVIVTVPLETGVTTPSTTFAISSLLEVQITFLLVAFAGVIVATSLSV